MTPLSWLTARLALYLITAAVVLSVVGRWEARLDGRLEERERAAVAHATQWHKGYVAEKALVAAAKKAAAVALRRSAALRDSVRIVSDSLIAIVTASDGKPPRVDTVPVPKIVIRRLVADSVLIWGRDSAGVHVPGFVDLVAMQNRVIALGDSTIASYQVALKAAQANRPGWFRRATAGIGHAAAGTACGATGWALGGPVVGLGAGALCAAVAGVVR